LQLTEANGRCVLGQATFAGTDGNGREAPRADPALGLPGEDRALNAGIRGTLNTRQLRAAG